MFQHSTSDSIRTPEPLKKSDFYFWFIVTMSFTLFFEMKLIESASEVLNKIIAFSNNILEAAFYACSFF